MMNSVFSIEGDKCTGCGACAQICPKNAISMEYDDEGFLVPKVDGGKCINCGICLKKCGTAYFKNERAISPWCYVVKTMKEVAEPSSSAGVFALLADYFLSLGGYVCGVVYDESFHVMHVVTNDRSVVEKMKKSKYVQSDSKKVYLQIQELLKADKFVLFSGTPCQVDALYSFLGQDYEKLLTVDIICHGVPASGMWEKYLDDNYDISEMESFDFRYRGSKDLHGSSYLGISYKDGRFYVTSRTKDYYYTAFQSDMILRRSCYSCKHKTLPHPADITIGDYWGAKEHHPELIDDDKMSLVLLNSLKGIQNFKCVKDRTILCMEITLEQACTANSFGEKRKMPQHRGKFYDSIKCGNSFNESVKQALYPNKYDAILMGIYLSPNFGAVVNTYALYKFLTNQGMDVACSISPEFYTSRDTVNAQFQKTHMKFEQLDAWKFSRYNWMTDTFIIGSDQLWNYTLCNKMHYYLDFVSDEAKRITYGTSFGFDYPTVFNGFSEQYPIQNKLMKRLDQVSIREKGGVAIANRDFNIDADQVLDPVFLLEPIDYDCLLDDFTIDKQDPRQGDYVATYYLAASETVNKFTELVSDHFGYPYVNMIVHIANEEVYQKRRDISLKPLLEDPLVEEWIYTIKNSKFVVTDSFHGTCFSIMYEKPFIIYVKGWAPDRIYSLLQVLGLERRMVKSLDELKENISLLDEPINYAEVTQKLMLKKFESREWLKKALRSPKSSYVRYRVEESADRELCLIKDLPEYIEYIKSKSDDYILISALNGNLQNTAHIRYLIKECNGSRNCYFGNDNYVNLLQNSSEIEIMGNGKENQTYLDITFTTEGLEKVLADDQQVYSIMFDWEATEGLGSFKIQLGGAPWDALSDEISMKTRKGHYENIFIFSAKIAQFKTNRLQIRLDNVKGILKIKNLVLLQGNRPIATTNVINGFALISDFKNSKCVISTTAIGTVKLEDGLDSFMVEYQNRGYKNLQDTIAEVYLQKTDSRIIYPCEAKDSLYYFVYSRKNERIVDIAVSMDEDNGYLLTHIG